MNREKALSGSKKLDRSRRVVFSDPILAELRLDGCFGVCLYEKVNGDYFLVESLCEGGNCAPCPPRPVVPSGTTVEDGDYYAIDCMTEAVRDTPKEVLDLLIREARKARFWRGMAVGLGILAVVLAAALAWALLGR